MVNMGELFRHDRIKHAEMERVPLSESEKKLYLLERGDLLFARQSLLLSGVGKCSIFIEDNEEVTFEGHLIRARINKRIANPAFYYYFFKSSIGRDVIEAYAEQVAAAGIRGSDLKNAPVPFPPLPEQVAIGKPSAGY
jgi:type I restriction enzyme S subunit